VVTGRVSLVDVTICDVVLDEHAAAIRDIARMRAGRWSFDIGREDTGTSPVDLCMPDG
jgi:hypothetical protein